MWRAWLLVVGLVGCASEPGVRPQFMATQKDAADFVTAITGPDYRVDFATTAGGVRIPRQISAGGTDLLVAGSCPEESQLGLGVYPVQTVVGGTATTGESESAYPSLEGPGMVWTESGFDVGYSCNGAQSVFGGVRFAFYPSGRILRHDIVDPSRSELGNGNACDGCAGTTTIADNLFFTSWYAFASSELVDENDNPLASDAQPQQACARFGDRMVGVRWAVGVDQSTRLKAVGGGTAFVFDIVPGNAGSLEPVPGDGGYELDSELVIGKPGETCAQVLGRAGDPLLRRGGTDLFSNNGTIDAGPYVTNEPVAITAMATTPRGFAVAVSELDLDKYEYMKVLIDGRAARYSVQQGQTPGFVFLWIDDVLATGETLTIEVE